MNKTGNERSAGKAVRGGHRPGWRPALALGLWACLLTGCSLAREEIPAREEDRLAGFLLTEQYLRVGTPELKMGADGKVTIVDKEERIPGTLSYDKYGPDGVVFDGIEGYVICDLKVREEESGSFAHYGIGDDIFSDVHWVSGDTESVETTVYVEEGGITGFYFNPIYQTPEGEVYLLPGTGLASGTRTEGETMSHSLSWERTFREGDEERKKEGSSFTVHITYAKRPAGQTLLFFREDGSLIGSMDGEELAEIWAEESWELRVPAEAAWLILEQEKESGETARTFCNRGDGKLEFLQSGENGYLIKRLVSLQWE